MPCAHSDNASATFSCFPALWWISIIYADWSCSFLWGSRNRQHIKLPQPCTAVKTCDWCKRIFFKFYFILLWGGTEWRGPGTGKGWLSRQDKHGWLGEAQAESENLNHHNCALFHREIGAAGMNCCHFLLWEAYITGWAAFTQKQETQQQLRHGLNFWSILLFCAFSHCR